MAVFGLCCCMWAFSSAGFLQCRLSPVWAFSHCGEQGYSLVAMHRLLIGVASLVVEHRLQACGLQYLQHMGSVVASPGF